MANEIQRYNVQQEFAVDRVYSKLTRGIEELPPGEAVDALLNGANCLRQGINQVVERIFQGAEVRQGLVVQRTTESLKTEAENLPKTIAEAMKTGNYVEVERCLNEATKANIVARESVNKLKYIKQRGQTEYDPVKDLTKFARDVEDFAKKKYLPTHKLLEGKISH